MADLGNTAVISPTDASNGSGTMPSWLGSAAPSTLDDAGRALQGATAREWECRSYPTATGTAPAFVVTYTVAPAALRTGQVYTFTAHAAAVGTDTLNANTLGAKNIMKVIAGVKTATAANDWYTNDKIACVYDGTDMVWSNRGVSPAASDTVSGIVELATTTETLTGTDAARAVTPDSLAALWEQGSDIASAGTISVGEGGYFAVTGTTTITDIDFATTKSGRIAWFVFAGALTLTHNATTLILPGAKDILTVAGDVACFISEGGDNVRCLSYVRTQVPPNSGTYTPTLFNTTNVAASTAYVAHWMRVGNIVTVAGRVDIDPTTTGISTVLGVSLPIASDFANDSEIGGCCNAVANISALAVWGDVTNNRALIQGIVGSASAFAAMFTFTYRVI
jgi:hypothetical protein